MEQRKKPNFLIGFIKTIWHSLDILRRTVFNVLILFLLIGVLISLTQRESGLANNTALLLMPYGNVVEEFSADPVEVAISRMNDEQEQETRMRDMLRALKLAKKDKRISQLVIIPDMMWSIGPAKLLELKEAVEDFKTSGKPVFAYARGMDKHQLLLASLADETWLHPEGIVFLDGYSRYRSYYKEGLEKLGVDVHLFRVGTYKSAAEPFIRNDMSEAAREANMSWLGSLWQEYRQNIAELRNLDQDGLDVSLDEAISKLGENNGDFAQMALQQGLVDKLATHKEMRDYLSEKGGRDPSHHSFRQVHFTDYLAMNPEFNLPGDSIGIVVAQGTILNGEQPRGTVGGDSTSRLLRQARFDDNIKAVVLRVDSPGGSVFASEQIRQEVLALKDAGKPVVVSMSTLAASGGYWISMNADEIWAQPNTITGSIGIFGLLLNYPDTLAKIGVYTDGVGTNELSGALRPDRKFNDRVGELIQLNIEKGYRNFIQRVADARSMDYETVDSIAQGRVWSGKQAMEHGLVDKMGGLNDAISSAAEHAELDDGWKTVYIERPISGFEQFLLNLSGSAGLGDYLGKMVSRLPEPLNQAFSDLSMLSGSNRDPGHMYAHCFCELP